MLATLLVIGSCLYLIGLRADRIHAGRAVTEPDVVTLRVASGRVRSGSVTTYRGLSASQWAARFRYRTRQLQSSTANVRRLQHVLQSKPSVTEAINLASVVYGNGSTLWALARCESTLNPWAQNASGSSGLMQFMPSTFAGTPYGRFSIWSPYASAFAAGWMLQHGRRSEWVC